ncbi:MAG TPA: DinB family protein [Thermoanaerobaculia bacterium]|jgi:uncharacterized damage-inducible protein DinB
MRNRFVLSVVLLGASASLAIAQAPTTTSTQVRAAAPALAPAPGFRADALAQLDDVGKKIVDLAQAVPAEKYGWRPAEGVRSVSEVYMHIAGANYFLPSFMGGKLPEGFSRDSEKKVTEKAQVVDWLKKSLDNVRTVVSNTPDADLDKKVKVFGGREMTERGLIMVMGNHLHEHLGQSIAYARMNGIRPPWSEGASEPPPAKK